MWWNIVMCDWNLDEKSLSKRQNLQRCISVMSKLCFRRNDKYCEANIYCWWHGRFIIIIQQKWHDMLSWGIVIILCKESDSCSTRCRESMITCMDNQEGICASQCLEPVVSWCAYKPMGSLPNSANKTCEVVTVCTLMWDIIYIFISFWKQSKECFSYLLPVSASHEKVESTRALNGRDSRIKLINYAFFSILFFSFSSNDIFH